MGGGAVCYGKLVGVARWVKEECQLIQDGVVQFTEIQRYSTWIDKILKQHCNEDLTDCFVTRLSRNLPSSGSQVYGKCAVAIFVFIFGVQFVW